MDNIYSSHPVKILNIKKHTSLEYSFLLDYKLKNEPGKFVMVSLPGFGEIPISISGFTPKGIELTIRNVGKVTSAIFNTKPGNYLYIRGPYGNTFPVEKFFGGHLLIIAGGSGIAAAKPLIEYFHQPTECTLKKLDILVGFRSPKHILFRNTLKEWAEWSNKCNVVLTVDANEDESKEWKGHIGFVIQYISHVEDIGSKTECVVIGPPKMMSNTILELLDHGVSPSNIWLSFERHMKCGAGKCGHCRIRDKYVCVDGPVFSYLEAKELVD